MIAWDILGRYCFSEFFSMSIVVIHIIKLLFNNCFILFYFFPANLLLWEAGDGVVSANNLEGQRESYFFFSHTDANTVSSSLYNCVCVCVHLHRNIVYGISF